MTGTSPGPDTGIMAIWNNCAPGHEAEYEHWYQTEHLPERLGIPGFRRGRRYEALDDKPMYFTYYELDSPDVLTTPVYRERVDNPTPLTRRIMSGVFTDMSRTACRRVACVGRMRGAFAATLRGRDVPAQSWLEAWMHEGCRATTLTRIEAWRADAGATGGPSTEAKLRGGDATIEACLFVEALREADCRTAVASLLAAGVVPEAEIGVYRLLSELTAPTIG